MRVRSQSKSQSVAVAAFVLSMAVAAVPSFMGLIVDACRFSFPANVLVALAVLVAAFFCRSTAGWKLLKRTVLSASLLFILALGFSSPDVVQDMVHSWLFACLFLWILFLLAACIFSSGKCAFFSKITLVGLWITLVSLTLGDCDSTRGSIVPRIVGPDNLLAGNDSCTVLPFTYQLVSADAGQATIRFVADGDTETVVVSNGKSSYFGPYSINLKSVDGSLPPRYVVADVCKQPWENAAYAGMALMAAGLFVQLFKKRKPC